MRTRHIDTYREGERVSVEIGTDDLVFRAVLERKSGEGFEAVGEPWLAAEQVAAS